MTSNNNGENEDRVRNDISDDLSDFATAEVRSDTHEFGASIDNGIDADRVAEGSAIAGTRSVFTRNGRARRASNIL